MKTNSIVVKTQDGFIETGSVTFNGQSFVSGGSCAWTDGNGKRRIIGYINEKRMTITTWSGEELGKCVFGNYWQNYVPGAYDQPKRFSVYSVIDGHAYHGFGSDSMNLIRLKEVKKIPRHYNLKLRRTTGAKG